MLMKRPINLGKQVFFNWDIISEVDDLSRFGAFLFNPLNHIACAMSSTQLSFGISLVLLG